MKSQRRLSKIKYRIRFKDKKNIIERFDGTSWKRKTIDEDQLWNFLVANESKQSVAKSPSVKEDKPDQKFVQYPLSEPSDEEITRTLWEITK